MRQSRIASPLTSLKLPNEPNCEPSCTTTLNRCCCSEQVLLEWDWLHSPQSWIASVGLSNKPTSHPRGGSSFFAVIWLS